MQCAIQAGDLPLQMRWLKDGAAVDVVNQLGLNVSQDTYSTTLVIPRVGREHAGNYTCAAANAAKTTLVTAPLVVSGKVTVVFAVATPAGHGAPVWGGVRWGGASRSDANINKHHEPALIHCANFLFGTVLVRKVHLARGAIRHFRFVIICLKFMRYFWM